MNYNRTKTLGVSNKIWKTIHYFIVIVMLQSSFIAPSQTIFKKYNELFSNQNVFLPLLNNPVVADSFSEDETKNMNVSNKEVIGAEKSTTLYDNIKTESTIFYSDIVLGSIGYDNQMGFDNPKDNLFKINLSETVLDANKKYILEYEVNGVDENTVLGKSINDNYVTGGYLVKFKNEWIKKTEELDPSWLKKERNIIFFNVPKGATYQYKIRNLVIKVIEDTKNINAKIVLNNQNAFLSKEGKIYLNGFVKLNELSNKKIFANGQELELKGNLFEGYIKASEDEDIVFQIKENNTIVDELKLTKINSLQADESYLIDNESTTISKYFESNKIDFLEISDAKLTIKDSALIENKFITSKVLRKIDLAPLESGMVNVTKDGKGYRFLPDGTIFNKPVALEIAYDSTLIPQGFTAKDIKTFYFDTKKKSWQALNRDSIDYINKRIISQTTHFTDYINGIIQTPESPQTSAFTPTMMNDIKAANPSSEMTIISPPEVSQKGDANISYPIKIPAGRNGMQPQVAIQYNSDGGNGWLGEGWNINTPAITIDTRWGVPTFDAINESEIYNLNGEQLMYPKLNDQDWMPNRHYDVSSAIYSTQSRNRLSNAVFTFRKQNNFSKLERLGTFPNYYWKVTSTDGTISWYGGKDGVDDNAVIRNNQGNIVHWSLFLVEDVYRNNIKYEYQKTFLSGLTGDNVNLNGGLIYNISRIYYTGENDGKGNYKIEFLNEATISRPDISINSRLGLKLVTPYRLSEIRVLYNSTLIRSYLLNYNIGKFNKSLLIKATERDANNKIFYAHDFQYYDDLADNNNALFGEAINLNIPKSDGINYALYFGNLLNTSSISSNQSVELGFDIRPAIGIEWKRKTNNDFKNITIGFPFSFYKSKDDGKINMVDIDGDGLEDVVYKTNSGLQYFKHTIDSNGNHLFGTVKSINQIGSFYHSEGKTTTKFLPFDIAFGKKKRKYIGFKKFQNKNYTDIYFTDGNGDGLMDIVKDDKVYFNSLNSNNEPTFYTSSQPTPNMVITAATIVPPPNPLDEVEPEDTFLNLQTNYDAVKVWVAPAGGYIAIRDIVNLNAIDTEDKVIYSIETTTKGGDEGGSLVRLYLKELTYNNPSASVSIGQYNSYSVPLGINSSEVFSMTAGQKVYFRVHKNTNSKNCVIDFNPTITYTSVDPNTFDENGIDQYMSKYSESFILSYDDTFEVPSNGSVSIDWPSVNVNQLSDDVTFKIIKVTELNNTISEQVIYEKFCDQYANTIVSPSTNSLSYNIGNIVINSSNPDELIYFYVIVNSDSNVRWKDIEWKPKFTYTPDLTTTTNDPTIEGFEQFIIPKYSIYSQNGVSKLSKYKLEPYVPIGVCSPEWNTPNTIQSYGIKINDVLEPSHNFLTANDNGSFLFVVKSNGHYIDKRKLTITNGNISVSNNNNPINIYTGNIYNILNPVNVSFEVYLESKMDYEIFTRYRKSLPTTVYHIQGGTGNINGCQHVVGGIFYLSYDWSSPLPQNDTVITFQSGMSTIYNPTHFGYSTFVKDLNPALGPLYNNWGQFFYNDELDSDTTIPSDNYSKLINNAIVNDPSITYDSNLLSQFGVDISLCQNQSDPEGCINNQIFNSFNLPGENDDFSGYSDADLDAIETNFSQSIQLPAICLLPGRPVRNINTSTGQQIERWEGIFSSNFISDTQGQVGDFEQTAFGDLPQGDEENILFPPQQADLNTGMYALSKYHKSISKTKTYGLGSLNLSMSNSNGSGKFSHAKNDFIDLNGDRYPDIITEDNISYTNMTGGHKDFSGNHNFGVITDTQSNAVGLTLSRTFLDSGRGNKTDQTSQTNTTETGNSNKGTQNKIKFDTGNPSTRASISLNLDGENYANKFWQDINGDGLADRVSVSNGNFSVQLNNGVLNALSSSENFTGLTTNITKPYPLSTSIGLTPLNIFGSTTSGNLNLSFNVDLGFSLSGNNTTTMLQDINSDGLTDVIVGDQIKINNGNSYDTASLPLSTTSLKFNSDSKTTTLAASGGASIYFTIFRFWAIVLKGGVSLGANYNLSLSDTNKSLKDFDGDGYLDFIEKTNSGIIYYPSNIKRTNKLKKVINPLGGSFEMDYEPQVLNYDNPNPKWAMTSLIINDGRDIAFDGVDIYKNSYKYENGKYDRRERSFFGYGKVTTSEYKDPTGSNPTLYRESVVEYLNKSYFLEGLVKKSTIKNASTGTSNIYSESENIYQLYTVNADGTINLNNPVANNFDVGGTEGRKQATVLLTKTKTTIKDFSTNAIETEINFEYDEYGRVKKYIDSGDLANTQDDYYSQIEYHVLNNNILTVPSEIRVFEGTTLKRHRITEVLNSNTGDITKIKAWINGTDFSETNMTYDTYGNLKKIIYPQNASGQSMFYEYTYDSILNKYVVRISDAFGYSSSSTYDNMFDVVTSTKDLAANLIKYSYDTFGRVTKIIAPKESVNTNPFTIKFEYMPTYSHLTALGYQNCISSTDFIPLAITKHYDSEHPTNDIETYTFIDGLARPIQVKKDIQINMGTSSSPNYVEYMSISGTTEYDEFGRAVKLYHPKKEPKSTCGNFLINEIIPSTFPPTPYYFTQKQYDVMNRPVKIIDPEGNESNFSYTLSNDGFGNLAMLNKSSVDQNTSVQIITENYKDIRGRVTSNKNIGPSGDIWTKFNYNAINELLSYVDDEGLTTSYIYDMLGRKTYVNHPDNGETYVTFDKASNMIRLQTANLSSIGQAVNYEYEYNRLQNIIYPTVNGNQNISNVTYKYGTPGSGNETGRLIFQQDATGTQDFKYGNMGEMVYNSRTIVAPNLPTRTFATRFEYDSWNRIQQLIYPDGEKVTYTYDLGGNLNQMTGTYNGANYNYIERIDYDHFEQRAYLLYGNKTETFYDYTPALRRLNNLVAKTSSGVAMFDNNYRYDKVGNVTRLDNVASYNPDNLLGGTYSHNYEYDNLNRLAHASGDFEGGISGSVLPSSTYDLNMKHNNTHGIVDKTQVHVQNNINNLTNTYSNKYDYYNGTHKVKEILDQSTGFSENFKYDLNGNLVNKSDSEGGNRKLFWDESNRLRVIDENDQMQHYIYDAGGERTLKASSHVEQVYENGQLVNSSNITFSTYTTYPSAFIVIDANQQYSKHYYAGTQRVVSKLGEENVSIFEARRKTTEAIGKDTKEPEVSYETIKQIQITDLQAILDKAKRGKALFKEYKPEKEPVVDAEGKEIERAPAQVGIYFFHPDHLGSSTFLTDGSGNPYQFFINLPFGETMYEQHSYSENFVNPYKFNGKEQDIETGLYYYGARYYDPKTSIWLSVDPLAEKFPNHSPYSYCFNNPINLIDPDGREPQDPPKGRVLAIFYHGGPDGLGSIHSTTKGTGGTGERYNATAAYAKSKGLDFKGAIIAPAAIEAPGVLTGMMFIKQNYKEGDQVIIYGYSYGGDNAVNLSEQLDSMNIPVSSMFIVDSSDGPGRGISVDTSIPDNVDTCYNFYQTNASGNSSGSASSGNSDNPNSSENSSSDGSSNLPGSRGFPHSSEGKAKVHNIKVTGKGVSHGNIQTRAGGNIQQAINKRIDETN